MSCAVESNRPKPRVLINMPLVLTRSVLVQNALGEMVPDSTWHERMRLLFASLYSFMRTERLVREKVGIDTPIDALVIDEDELTQDGLRLWRSGAIDRWLGSFDRSPGKSVSDHKQLLTALKRVRTDGPKAH